MNPKTFFKRWREGIKTLSVSRQLKAKIVGQIGSIIGISLAAIVMSFRGYWYFLLFMFFFVFLQVVDLIGTKQQYENVKQVEIALQGGNQDEEMVK